MLLNCARWQKVLKNIVCGLRQSSISFLLTNSVSILTDKVQSEVESCQFLPKTIFFFLFFFFFFNFNHRCVQLQNTQIWTFTHLFLLNVKIVKCSYCHKTKWTPYLLTLHHNQSRLLKCQLRQMTQLLQPV